MTYIIAEIGVNHNGSPALASKLIDEAVNAGADAEEIKALISDEAAQIVESLQRVGIGEDLWAKL